MNKCVRCGAPDAKIKQYGVYFCTYDCADRISDYALEDAVSQVVVTKRKEDHAERLREIAALLADYCARGKSAGLYCPSVVKEVQYLRDTADGKIGDPYHDYYDGEPYVEAEEEDQAPIDDINRTFSVDPPASSYYEYQKQRAEGKNPCGWNDGTGL